MARTFFSKTEVSPNEGRGADINYVDADVANGNSVYNDGSVGVMVRTGADPVSVTVRVPTKFDGDLDVSPRVENMAANATYYFGPFPPALYNSPDSAVLLDYTAPCQIAPFFIV